MSGSKEEWKMSEAGYEQKRVSVSGLKWEKLEVIVIAQDHYDSAS